MATAAALLSTSARRLSSIRFAAARRLSTSSCFSASSIAVREVTGSHKFTINGYTQSKKIVRSKGWTSSTFNVAGSRWKIWYGPYGHEDTAGNQHISLYLHLDDVRHGAGASDVEFKFSLLDRSGNPVPEFTRATAELCCFNGESNWRAGFEDFITWRDLEQSGCLEDDRFSVRCDITAVRGFYNNDDAAAQVAAHVVVPPSDLSEHLADLLWKEKHGTDVTVDVGGDATFNAHGCILAARSPVFRAELDLLAVSNSKKSAAAGHRRIEIKDMEPGVFDAVLHYMYTDALTEAVTAAEGHGGVAAVLAAAFRFKIERLRLMCEEMLCRRIDAGNVADILVVAERHGCRGLRAACFEFMAASPANLKAVVATEGYERLRAECPGLLTEFVMMKQLTATT